jgi:phage gp16-like protein
VIGRAQIALVHVARAQLGIDEDTYREMLGSLGAESSKDLDFARFDALMERFKAAGFRGRPKPAKPAGNRLRPVRDWMIEREAPEKQPLLWKIEGLLTGLGLEWAYADGIARNMWGVSVVRWCQPDQLRGVVVALIRQRHRAERRGTENTNREGSR